MKHHSSQIFLASFKICIYLDYASLFRNFLRYFIIFTDVSGKNVLAKLSKTAKFQEFWR